MSRKPALGYASRTDAVLALMSQRVPLRVIADRLGITPSTVLALEASGHRSRKRREAAAATGEPVGARTVVFPTAVLDRLGPHAARRNMHPNTLARLIVETVLDEQMVDAVLDDLEGVTA